MTRILFLITAEEMYGNQTQETVIGDKNYVMTNTYDANNRLTNISEDPAKDGVNWYVYCRNSSVMLVDLSVYLNEGYDENVNWHDWDAGAYGADVGNINYGFAALEVYDVEASLWGAGMLYKIQGRSNDL